MTQIQIVQVGNIIIGNQSPPVLIAGPCVIESQNHCLKMAEILAQIAEDKGFSLIFKSSFDKVNRSSIFSYRGPGLKEGLKILAEVKKRLGLPILTDIHETSQIKAATSVVDMIQIPAFLCRQTDLYLEAGRHNIPVNVKKGQFMAPADMKNIVEKSREAGIKALTLTERGTSFGYNRLIVDFTGIPIMRDLGVPVIFDATHSVQMPGGGGSFTSGNRDFVPHLCRAAVAVGCDALFLEVHNEPDNALSDGQNMVSPDALKRILDDIKSIGIPPP